MRIFFSASIQGRDNFEEHYRAIVNDLRGRGFKVQADHVLNIDKQKLSDVSDKFRIDYYRKLVRWISAADLVVAEVSQPSISIGYEVSLALEKGKNVIALSSTTRGPAILLALESDRLQMLHYSLADLNPTLDKAVAQAKDKTDIRFNFFVSQQLNAYIDRVSRFKRQPRAVYLRDLLEKEMRKNKEYRQMD